MSFSKEVKEELAGQTGSARHCQMAELAAMMCFSGQYGRDGEGLYTIGFQLENEVVLRKCFTLLEKTYNIEKNVGITEG
ncbi:MAG: DNA-binding protein WhiA, partial [Acetatifactor sp.]|nr:DNA-binding protein WhiA [Acetatifactor sp.]